MSVVAVSFVSFAAGAAAVWFGRAPAASFVSGVVAFARDRVARVRSVFSK